MAEGSTSRVLGQTGIEWAEQRGLDPELLVRLGIFTVRAARTATGEFAGCVPDERGNIIAFPYTERGQDVAEKWRRLDKKGFMQRPGGRKTFWNSDVLDDPALERGDYPLVITEGEPDAVVAIQCGFRHTVSCPDGAPAVPKGRSAVDLDPIDPEQERIGKFEYIWNNRERIARVKRFILAVDGDEPGRRLEAELLRRLSPARCMLVEYPEGCKDLNDVLMKFGAEYVAAVLNEAVPYPVQGVYKLSEYPQARELSALSTGWSVLDQHCKIFPGEFMVLTGIPGDGKSTFIGNLIINMRRLHGWRTALFSPEMPVIPHQRDLLRRIVGRGSRLGEQQVDDWIESAVVFLDNDPYGSTEDDLTLEWIVEKATDAVLRDGIRMLVIDPWNEVEHARRRDETTDDYIGRSIRMLRRFGRRFSVAVLVSAHPTKEVNAPNGKVRVPSLYDVNGSANWYNKCDHGVVVHRGEGNRTEIIVAKSRFMEAGVRGMVNLKFDAWSSRFELLDTVQMGLFGDKQTSNK